MGEGEGTIRNREVQDFVYPEGFEEAYRAFMDQQMTGVAEELTQLAPTMGWDDEALEAQIQEKRAAREALSPQDRMSKYKNNFHCWFPGGSYRTGGAYHKTGPEAEALMTAVDQMLDEGGDAFKRRLDSEEGGEGSAEALRALVELFLALEKKGFDAALMRA